MALPPGRWTIQPTRNVSPLERAIGVPSIRMTAAIETALMSMPTASGRI
jgi:hypothetical protein